MDGTLVDTTYRGDTIGMSGADYGMPGGGGKRHGAAAMTALDSISRCAKRQEAEHRRAKTQREEYGKKRKQGNTGHASTVQSEKRVIRSDVP